MARFGQYLQKLGLLSSEQLEQALEHQAVQGARLGTNLVELGLLAPERLAECLSDFHKVALPPRPWLERPHRPAIKRVSRPLVERIRFIPMRLEGNVLHVAVLDPRNPRVLDDLRFAAGCRIQPYVLPELWMHEWLLLLFDVPRGIREVAAPPAQAWGAGTSALSGIDGFEPTAFVPQPLPTLATRSKRTKGSTPGAPAAPRTHARTSVPPPLGKWSPPRANTRPPPPPPPPRIPSVPVLSVLEPSPPLAPAALDAAAPSQRPPWQPAAMTAQSLADLSAAARSPIDTSPTAAAVTGSAPPAAGSFWFPKGEEPAFAATPGSRAEHAGRAEDAGQAESAAAGHDVASPRAVVEPSETADDEPASELLPAPSQLEAPQLEPRRSEPEPALVLAELEAALAQSADREELIERALAVAQRFAPVTALFVIQRGTIQGVCSRVGAATRAIDGLLVPVEGASMLAEAASASQPMRVDPRQRPIDARMTELVDASAAEEVSLFPVLIRQRAVNVLYASSGAGPLGAIAFAALAALADSMSAAYEQIILARKSGGGQPR
jgi:hypothetical protein